LATGDPTFERTTRALLLTMWISKLDNREMPAPAAPDRQSMIRSLFSFPNPVNEVSARLVAAGVVTMCLAAILLDARWLTFVIAYGFIARVLTGPTMSPLGQLVTRVITPRLPVAPKLVAGPPKRFAQGIGAMVTTVALVLVLLGLWTAAKLVLGLIVVAALMESALGFCLGCWIFALLMRVGVVPAEVCDHCQDIWAPSRGAAPIA